MNKRKWLLCEDHVLMSKGMVSFFEEKWPDIEYIVVHNGLEGKEQLQEHDFEMVVTDISMPEMDGLELIEYIRATGYDTKVVLYTNYDSYGYVERAHKLKVNGYIDKSIHPKRILDYLERIANGETVYCNKSDKILKHILRNKIVITDREKEIIGMLIKGVKTPEIAQKLFIADTTVKTHRQNIYRKLNVNSAAELTEFCVRNNIV